MITELAALKWEGQYPKLKEASAMCINFSKHVLSDTRYLRYLQEIWSGPGEKDDKHLAIASLNSCLENESQLIVSACGTSLRKCVLTGGLWISGWRIYLLNPGLSGGRNTRSSMELESHRLSVNLVGPRFKGWDNSRPKLSAIVMRSSVCMEWWWEEDPNYCL